MLQLQLSVYIHQHFQKTAFLWIKLLIFILKSDFYIICIIIYDFCEFVAIVLNLLLCINSIFKMFKIPILVTSM